MEVRARYTVPLKHGGAMPIDQNVAVMYVLVGVSFLVSLISGIVTIIKSFARRPPIDQELINYVRHPDLLSSEARLRAELNEINDRYDRTTAELFKIVRDLQSQVNKTFADIDRSLGRIEGELKTLPRRRTDQEVEDGR